ncbi:MAG TPA: radical SAM protein, partial [Thermotoga sp.]|nr:radical SAM protein [Thermotoga sp.]
TDYPWLDDILNILEKYSIKFSVSSMRMDGISPRLLMLLKKSGQKTFTVAPEGGSQKIRDILGKDLKEKDIENALKMGKKAGFDRIKMYFIYGIEEENEEDLIAIKELADFARSLGYTKITLSLNPLIPKPKTPFEKRTMLSFHELRERFAFLKRILKGYRITFEGIRESIIQHKLAFADKFLSKEWIEIYKKFGAKELKRQILKS